MPPRRAATQALSQNRQSPTHEPDRSRQATQKSLRKGDTSQLIASSNGHAPAPAHHFSTTTPSYSLTSVVQFLTTAAVTLVLQTAFSAFVEKLRGEELGSVSRHFDSTWSVLGLTAWKVLELAVGWFAGYGNVAIAPFITLLRLPHMYLLNAFYEVPFGPLFAELVTHFSSAAIGFSIYRRPAVYSPRKSSEVLDSTMRADYSFQLSCTVFTTALYAVAVLASIYTWLPVHLAVHWDGLKTLEKAHDATVLSMLQHFVGMGWCTTYLLLDYVSSASEGGTKAAASTSSTNTFEHFDPTTASLGEHLRYNLSHLLFWRQAKPAGRSLLKHTVFLAACLTIDAAFQSCATIAGCEINGRAWIAGPLPWGALWGSGMIISGLSLGWVAGVLS